jgi:hypothetical protein
MGSSNAQNFLSLRQQQIRNPIHRSIGTRSIPTASVSNQVQHFLLAIGGELPEALQHKLL